MRGESLVVFCVPAMLHKSTKQTEMPRQGEHRGQSYAAPRCDVSGGTKLDSDGECII